MRAAFRTKVDGLLASDGFTFVESVNLAESTRDLPPKWYTLDFPPANNERTSLGMPARFVETGRVMVSIFIPAQTQDTDAVDAADKVRTEMANWFDPTGRIRVTAPQPPSDGGDFRGAHYGVTVDLTYTYETFV